MPTTLPCVWINPNRNVSQKQAFSDPHNYALSCRARVALGRDTTLNGVVEAPDAAHLWTAGRLLAAGDVQGAATTLSAADTAAARVWLKRALPGHDLRAAVAWQGDAVDSAACYVTMPITASIDLASKERTDGLQYQLGLHKVRVCVDVCMH